jgi:type I restriction enzyme S subunit
MKQAKTTKNKLMIDVKPFYNSFIPFNWTTPEFGEVFTFLKTFAFSREQLTCKKTSDEIQNIHYGDIHATYKNEILDLQTEKSVPYLIDGLIDIKNFQDIDFPCLKDGDLIIADASEDYEGVCNCIELKNINHKKVVSGLHTFAVRGDANKIAIGFRTYALNNAQVVRELRRIATGISVYGVSKTNISKVKLPLPPLSEQTRIAELLSVWDKAISTMQATIEQVELRNKWLMQELLTGKKRLKGFEETKWKNKKLSDCLNYTPREVPKPSSSFFALGIRCHAKGIFHKNDFEPEDLAMDVLYKVRENDLIVNITFAWEHAIAIAGKQDDGGLVSHRFPTYTFKTDNAIHEFFRYFILQKKFKYQLDLISPGGAGRNRVMSKKDFPKIEVRVPDIEEQKAIANFLDKSFDELSLLRIKLEKLRLQKQGLMQVLLTGRKRFFKN